MHEIFEHTADFGLRIRAPDLCTLFAEAAEALFSAFVANRGGISPVESVTVSLPTADPEELLHDWLSELLFLFSTRRIVFCQFEVRFTDAGLEGIARGEKIDRKRHEIELEVKAITWHGLKIEKTPEGYLAEVIVDI
ncbi:MAG: archease [Pirellulales bacterium]|nr:archease [Pirellulales bacterium]